MKLESIQKTGEGDATQAQEATSTERSWWEIYADQLAASGLTESALTVVGLDSDYVISHGVFGAGEPGSPNWPESRLRRGLVMGAVQSGKTASMIGVATKALDHGVNIIVILAGTRVALWRQTYERILSQLDGWDESLDRERRQKRVLLPLPGVALQLPGSSDLGSLYFETPNLVRRLVTSGRPLIAVVMKHADHLISFSQFIHRVFEDVFERSDKTLHMLVIDDEADDGSILDSQIEAGLAPDSEGLKQIPRHIARLWSGGSMSRDTVHERLYATYLAYTATPQANFLQADHNPLSPTDFLAALRVPLDEGAVSGPRSTTYKEPNGVGSYYSGGELFYRRVTGPSGSLCNTRPFPQRDDYSTADEFASAVAAVRADLLSDALRAYFVSGAIRLLFDRKRLSHARSVSAASESEIRAISPAPHSMLFHPSARVDSHFLAANEIVAWSAEFGAGDVEPAAPTFQLDVEGLRARLEREEEHWKKWLSQFDLTREKLSYLPGGAIFPRVDEPLWHEVKKLLVDEVFPHTRLTVINSDPRADDRPRFQPLALGDGLFRAANDIFTIFVSGNVMARGITIEGLVTTLFLRSATEPLADTQMQMQRWFGYRGDLLCWCRVFLFDDQLHLFRTYHENDEAIRREIVTEMNVNPGRAVNPLVLQGVNFRATGKIANLRALPLCPGADPFARVIETGSFAQHNLSVLSELIDKNVWNDVSVGGILRGKAMARTMSMLEVAALMERFRYSDHDPDPQAENHFRWRALASELDLPDSLAPLYRPPGHLPKYKEKVAPPDCPYSIAAYLRLWDALLSRRARGLYPTDDRRVPWSMIDLARYAADAPHFYVGVRYGSAGTSSHDGLKAAGVQCMTRESRDGILVSTWGSRNPGSSHDSYLGDQLFDYHVHSGIPPERIPGEPLWRKRGAPAQLLFHVIRTGAGQDAVTVGLALPLGGPDHIAALRSV